jgi:hypothetical protein
VTEANFRWALEAVASASLLGRFNSSLSSIALCFAKNLLEIRASPIAKVPKQKLREIVYLREFPRRAFAALSNFIYLIQILVKPKTKAVEAAFLPFTTALIV